jgi:hypothetical protein
VTLVGDLEQQLPRLVGHPSPGPSRAAARSPQALMSAAARPRAARDAAPRCRRSRCRGRGARSRASAAVSS